MVSQLVSVRSFMRKKPWIFSPFSVRWANTLLPISRMVSTRPMTDTVSPRPSSFSLVQVSASA